MPKSPSPQLKTAEELRLDEHARRACRASNGGVTEIVGL